MRTIARKFVKISAVGICAAALSLMVVWGTPSGAQAIFGSDTNPAVPGGSITKPLMIALLGYLASRYFAGGQKEEPASSTPEPLPRSSDPLPGSTAEPSPGSVLDGLGGLIEQFQKKGFGDAIDSWVNTGANKDVASRDTWRRLRR